MDFISDFANISGAAEGQRQFELRPGNTGAPQYPNTLTPAMGTGQTPLVTFRTIHLPDNVVTTARCTDRKADRTLNCRGAGVSSPFQLQVALKYIF